MPIQGFTRMRRHQFGRQSAFGNPIYATRLYPFSGTPTADMAWTDPEVDVGSIDVVAPPFHGIIRGTANLTDPAVTYNNLPLMFSAILGGGVDAVGAGTDKTWTFDPASDGSDAVDCYSYEFGDDVVSDWFRFSDGYLTSLELSGPEGLGPLTASMSWAFGGVASTGSTDYPAEGGVPSDLTLDLTDPKVYLKDGLIRIADTTAGLAAGQITDALHSFVFRINQPWDEKRFANQTQDFSLSGLGRGARAFELEATYAKTSQTVGTGSESDDWMSEEPVTRYVQLEFKSLVMTTGIIPYSLTMTMPMRYYTRTEGAVGGNTVVVLTGHAFDEEVSYGGVFNATVVNTLATALLDGTETS